MKRICLAIALVALAGCASAQTITLSPTVAVTFPSPDQNAPALTGYRAYVFDHQPAPPDVATPLAGTNSGAVTVPKASATVLAGGASPVYKLPLSAFNLTIPPCVNTSTCPLYWIIVAPVGPGGENRSVVQTSAESLQQPIPNALPAAVGPVHLVAQ